VSTTRKGCGKVGTLFRGTFKRPSSRLEERPQEEAKKTLPLGNLRGNFKGEEKVKFSCRKRMFVTGATKANQREKWVRERGNLS